MNVTAEVPVASDAFDGRYILLRQVGVGGVGRVWEAVHAHTGRHVALKTLRDEFAAETRWMQRFLREARAVARIRHPNVVEVLDMRAGDAPYIVYELLEGEGLDARLAAAPDGHLDVTAALRVMVPVGAALAAAHAEGIVHRDLKPSNVFLARDARGDEVPKVIDFGLAKHAGDDITVTTSNVVLGTPAYMAPEQARSETDIDSQADVWSFGATLFECLTGALPVDGPNATVVLRRLAREEVRSLRSAAPDLDPEVAAVVDRCLIPDRSQRFGTMREVVDALTATAAWQRAGLAAPVFTCERAVRSPRTVAPEPGGPRRATERPIRAQAKVALAMGAGALVTALAGASLVRWWLKEPTPDSARAPGATPVAAVVASPDEAPRVSARAPLPAATPSPPRRSPPSAQPLTRRGAPARPRGPFAATVPAAPAPSPPAPSAPAPTVDPLEPDRRYP
jgi:serine/threonine-protein kinase